MARRFNATCVDEAFQQAPVIAGLEASKIYPEQIRIVDAFNMTLQNSKRKLPDKRWEWAVKPFIKWLAVNHPYCTHWHLLTRQIIKEYLRVYELKSNNHKRLQLQPIRQTSQFMNSEYELPDIASNLRIGSAIKTTPKEVYLEDVLNFCNYLKENNPRIEVGVVLQGLAGLQLQEATRLTWDKVDLQKGLIEISGDVKNSYRNRVIPVCGRVMDALIRADKKRCLKKQKVYEIPEAVLINQSGFAYGSGNYDSYSREVRAEIRKWNSQINWTAKDFRNCLLTFASLQGLLNDIWEQYVGHAPKSVTAKHYIPKLTSVSLGERRAIEKAMDVFRQQVIQPLERAIESVTENKILNFFEHKSTINEIGQSGESNNSNK